MQLKEYKIIKQLLLLITLCAVMSCRVNRKEFTEPPKDITGVWQVTKVLQNNKDITAYVDLTQFTVTFNKDKTYVLTGQFPFIVYENGTWSLNDPQYPFAITFTPSSTNTAVTSKLAFTIVSNHYQLGINFTNGCQDFQNSYQYTLNPATSK